MEVRTRDEFLRELIARAEENPHGWRAAVRRDPRLFAKEYYIFHPKAGVYELKEYQVNPFEAAGVGAHLAPSVPGDLPGVLEREAGAFAIMEITLARLQEALEETSRGPSLPEAGLRASIRIPMRGSIHGAPSSLRFLDSTLEKKRHDVDAEFRKLIDRRGLTRAYA
ncbi:MAG TPA: hypothetical protein VIB49_05280 [Thermoplasmata archaeon]